MTTLEAAVLLALATWRVSSLLYDEDGPWELFRRLREKVLHIQYVDGIPTVYPTLLEPLSCFWCVTLLVAMSFSAYYMHYLTIDLTQGVLLWLASSAGAVFMERWVLRSKARV